MSFISKRLKTMSPDASMAKSFKLLDKTIDLKLEMK